MTIRNQVGNLLTGSSGTGAFVGANSPTLVTPNLIIARATTLSFNPSTGGIIGTTTNNNTNAGNVGEFISTVILSANAANLTTGTPYGGLVVALTAGDWDVWGNVVFNGGVTTIVQFVECQINTSIGYASNSTTTCAIDYGTPITTPFAQGTIGIISNVARLSFSAASTNIYLVVAAGFTVSTMTYCGGIYARRRR